MSVYTDEAAAAAAQMWTKGLRVHQIRAALERRHPRDDGWSLSDVHAAASQHARAERERRIA